MGIKLTNITTLFFNIIFLLICCFPFYSIYPSNNFDLIINYEDYILTENSLTPFFDIEISKECNYPKKNIILGNFIGINYCDCRQSSSYNKSLIEHECNISDFNKGCFSYEKIQKIDFTNYEGYKICVRKGKDYLYYSKYSSKNECKANYKKCGLLDSNNILCIPNNSSCPLNFFKINENKTLDLPFNIKTIQISNNKYIHYSNENINSPVIVSFNVSEIRKPCLNINESHINYYNGKYEKCMIIDDSYELIDSISKKQFYEQNNNLYHSLQNINNYPINNLINDTISLYSRPYNQKFLNQKNVLLLSSKSKLFYIKICYFGCVFSLLFNIFISFFLLLGLFFKCNIYKGCMICCDECSCKCDNCICQCDDICSICDCRCNSNDLKCDNCDCKCNNCDCGDCKCDNLGEGAIGLLVVLVAVILIAIAIAAIVFLIYGLSALSDILFFGNNFHIGIKRVNYLLLFVDFLIFGFSFFVLVILFTLNYNLQSDKEIYDVFQLFNMFKKVFLLSCCLSFFFGLLLYIIILYEKGYCQRNEDDSDNDKLNSNKNNINDGDNYNKLSPINQNFI